METIRKIIKSANGWLIKSLITIIFLGVVGWVAYNTHAADRIEGNLSVVDKKCDRNETKIDTIKEDALEFKGEVRDVLKEIRGDIKTLLARD